MRLWGDKSLCIYTIRQRKRAENGRFQHTEKVEARAFFPSKTFARDVSSSPAKDGTTSNTHEQYKKPPGAERSKATRDFIAGPPALERCLGSRQANYKR